MGQGYEFQEYGEVLLEIDGVRYGSSANNSLVHVNGNGNGGGMDDTDWQNASFEVFLAPGIRTITIGAYNNGATFSDEFVEVFIDDVSLMVLDGVAPTADVTDVSPDPRIAAVDEIEIVFSEEITGLDAGDLTLKRGGGANLLVGSEPLTSPDGITWTLGSLGSLTAPLGAYTLTIEAVGSGIEDLAGNPMTVDASDIWVRSSTPPFVDDALADFAVDEDALDSVVDLAGVFGDADPGDSLSLSVTGNTNTDLVTTDLAGENLTLSYASDANGSADITIRATDLDGDWIEDIFTVAVNPANDQPFVDTAIDDVTVDENAPDTVVDLADMFDDIDVGDILTLTVTDNGDPELVTSEIVAAELTLSYGLNKYGTSNITVRATDLAGEWTEDTFLVTVISDGNDPPFVANPIGDVTVDANAPDTVLDLSDVFEEPPGILPTLDYAAVEIDPVTGAPAAETGLFAYTFTLYGNDGVDASFTTMSLTFTGPIRQTTFNWNNADYPVHDEATADMFDSASTYSKHLDTWRYNGWTNTIAGDSNLPPANMFDPGPQNGEDVIISAYTDTTTHSQQKDLVYIVAGGEVQWSGSFIRQSVSYGTSGTARGNRLMLSVEGNTNQDLVIASVLDSQLTLVYAPGANGEADITVRATDPDGAWVEDTFTVMVTAAAEVVGRHVFYNNSALDAGGDDDAAIDPVKTPLLPQGTASSDNYTSYSRGINGIMVDIDGLAGVPTIGDIGVRVNQAATPDTWSTGPAPESVTVRAGEGVGGSDRVTIVWADGAILNQWVEVSVLPGANTGLGAADVFYAGNVVGETNNDGRIGIGDLTALVSEFGMRGGAELLADVNIDGRVDLTDLTIMRSNFGTSLGLPTMPPAAPPAAAPPAAAAAPVSELTVDILAESATSKEEDAIVGVDVPVLSLVAVLSDSAVESTATPGFRAADSTATTLYRAAMEEYDLRPLGDDLDTGEVDDLLADILAESPLAIPL
jgi:hypothetical protein